MFSKNSVIFKLAHKVAWLIGQMFSIQLLLWVIKKKVYVAAGQVAQWLRVPYLQFFFLMFLCNYE